ncbi:MAG: hypothetical protein HY914_02185 [Desulfomonile tiedjei]|nr:hypothetical protein [Desulfomonile tiedjei]
MKRKGFTMDQIVRMLREAELHISEEKNVRHVSRELGITEQTKGFPWTSTTSILP